jgi:hypothetical protein
MFSIPYHFYELKCIFPIDYDYISFKKGLSQRPSGHSHTKGIHNMAIPKTLISKTVVNEYGNTLYVSIVHKPEGWDGHSDRPESWIVRVQRNNDPCFYGKAYKTKIEASNAYCEI